MTDDRRDPPEDSSGPAEEPDDDYSVGYKKPPKHSRFKPGQTGNPKGRKKGRTSLRALIDKVLHELIPLRNSKHKLPALEVLVRNARNRAIGGDPKSITGLIALMRAAGIIEPEAAHDADTPLTEDDVALIADYWQRQSKKGQES